MSDKIRSAASLAIAGVFSAALSIAASADANPMLGPDQEQCYGIAKKGENDCANAAGTHTCSGSSKIDYEGGEWKAVKKGTCEKIEVTLPDGKKRAGSLKPIAG